MADVVTFQVQTGSFPGRIQLSWTLDENLSANEEIRIRRALSIFPLSTEGTLVFSSGNSSIVEYEDQDLDPDTFYYYTIFVYDTSTSTYRDFGLTGQDFALSYREWGEGDRLYNLLASDIRAVHEVLGGDNNTLKKLMLSVGNMMDFYRSFVLTAGYWRRPDIAPENILDFYSLMWGFEPERGFDLRVLRQLALGLVGVYKRKGTCGGLVDFIKIFTTWDAQCDDAVDLTFRWWDPDTKRVLSYLTGSGARKAIDTNQSFTSNLWQNGKFSDPLDDIFYTIVGNTTTEIIFENKTPPFERLDGIGGIGISAIELQDTGQSWTDDQWRGYRLYIDTFSTTEYFTIISNTSDILTVNPKKTNYGTPAVFQEVGLDMIAGGGVEYRIEPEYYVQQGRHSLTYDNTVPPGFRGTSKDPAHFYVGGSRSLLSLGQFSPLSVLVIIEGVANFVGRSTNLVGNVLTDDNADFGAIDSLVGKRLNPNVLQAQDFEITGNTATTITVSGDLTKVAAIGNNYFVLDELSSIKTRRLREVIPEFVPHDVDVFLFFEPQ